MSLSDREYMYETYEEKKKARQEKEEKRNRKNELWRLYAKEHKTRKDRQRIEQLEYFNLHGKELKVDHIVHKRTGSLLSKYILIFLCVIAFIIYIYANYFN